mmetsp:Transcript_21281/g.60617  ORF Transcript_21281/g.60617 Transcript_21281/m.60617 type:complete len:197 (+) Transcript_21281:193-783(+)
MHHRGAVLECAPLRLDRTEHDARTWDIAGGAQSRLLVLDQVQDPQNLGAILRSSYFLGVDHVALTKSNSAPPTPAVSRVSCGALELLAAEKRLHVIKGSTAEFIAGLNERGWATFATHLGQDAQGPEVLTRRGCAALVLGNEETGVREHVVNACTGNVAISKGRAAIAPSRAASQVDSLNVSASAAILLHFLSQRS